MGRNGSSIMSNVGERIRERRIELGLSQEELAIKCGYKSRSSINKIELSRDLPLDKIQKAAKALDVSPSYLACWTDDMKSYDDNVSPIEYEEVLQEVLDRFSKLDENKKNVVLELLRSFSDN
jgi:transcriptional regulator with XRE-family HTH domain